MRRDQVETRCHGCGTLSFVPEGGHCPHCRRGPAVPSDERVLRLHGERIAVPDDAAERRALWGQTKPISQTIPENATIAPGKVVHGMTARMIVDVYERLMRDEGARPTAERVAEEFYMSGRNLRRRMRALEMPSWPPVLPRGV